MTRLRAALEATWPPRACHPTGPFVVREGGGGQRVSAATCEGAWTPADLDAVEARQRALGQTPLFMIRPGEDRLDAALAARGYRLKDPVNHYHGPIAPLAAPPLPPLAAFALWPPLGAIRALWAEGGIGPERIAVMERAAAPKAAILARARDRVAGAAFVAIHDAIAVLHALYVRPELRRQGSAVNIVRMAARWAQDHGAKEISILVTRENAPANALYASLGMRVVGHYHYRSKQPGSGKRGAVEGQPPRPDGT